MTTPAERLGALLTAAEARNLAAILADGSSVGAAMNVIAPRRRHAVRTALDEAGVGPSPGSAELLQAIAGAAGRQTQLTPVWTIPDIGPTFGGVTKSLRDVIRTARLSVVCSTYNFQRSSGLWTALHEVSERGFVEVRLYLDPTACTDPTPQEVAAHLRTAHVFVTRPVDGRPVRNHAKFVSVDHHSVVITSANFSASAERHNLELGVQMTSPSLAERIEAQARAWEGSRFRAVTPRL